jgi:septum formation protein
MSEKIEFDPCFWKGSHPLVLASRSRARLAVLQASGIPVEAYPSDLDERRFEAPARSAGASASEIAIMLAKEKAKQVSLKTRERFVIGADQTLSFEGRIFHKPETVNELRNRLRLFSGKTHALHAAVALARDGDVLFERQDTVALTFRTLSDEFIDCYVALVGEAGLSSAAGYEIEGLGIQLMEGIEGQHATILGMPILVVLDWLRHLNLVLS